MIDVVHTRSTKAMPLTIHNAEPGLRVESEFSCTCLVLPVPHIVRVSPDPARYQALWPVRGTRSRVGGLSEPWSSAVPEDACRALLARLEYEAEQGTELGLLWRETRG